MVMKFDKHNPLFRSASRHQTGLERKERDRAYESPPMLLICRSCHKEEVFLRGLCRECSVQFG